LAKNQSPRLEDPVEMDPEELLGMSVWSRGHEIKGKCVGTRTCTLEGCGAWRVGVRWPDGHITWPCIKGMKFVGLRVLEII
jgi:hypothetical protein